MAEHVDRWNDTPAVDIARAPLGGRTFESFGEDPLLQARLVAPEIVAVQAYAVVACIKHYIVNNQEVQQNSIDVHVDERTLQEIYLPHTGGRAGVEVAQVYLGLPAVASAPSKRLAGWARVPLASGEHRQITVTLDPQSQERPVSFWNGNAHDWEIANGEYHVYIGASSRDIRLTGRFLIERMDRN